MKLITAEKIKKAVCDLCVQANLVLRNDVLKALKAAYTAERNKRAKAILGAIISNAAIARREKIAVCQDTGLACVFVELGQGVKITGNLKSSIQKGVEEGYKKAFLRNSVVKDPILRGRPGYVPAVIYIDVVKTDRIKITVLPKGFGCENKTQLKMLNPTAKLPEIKSFIIDAVRKAGPDACPPYIVGVGIGGSADYAAFLAKKALLRRTTQYAILNTNIRKLERDLLSAINKLNIGPMGLGGKTTALAVNIETYPTHIAGLPVAVNLSCHALRSASCVI